MRPLSPTVEDLGMKTVLLASNLLWGQRHPQAHVHKRVEQELRSQPTRTPIDTIRNPIWSRCGFFLCSHHFIKLTFADFPLNIVGSFLNVIESGLEAMVPLALDA